MKTDWLIDYLSNEAPSYGCQSSYPGSGELVGNIAQVDTRQPTGSAPGDIWPRSGYERARRRKTVSRPGRRHLWAVDVGPCSRGNGSVAAAVWLRSIDARLCHANGSPFIPQGHPVAAAPPRRFKGRTSNLGKGGISNYMCSISENLRSRL